jgi:chromosome segregation ATPase
MTHRDSVFTGAHRTVSGLAIVFLVVAAFFGFLNSQKMKALRATAANAQAARDAALRRELNARLNEPADEAVGTEQPDKIVDAQDRAAKAEAELAQIQKEKADLQSKLDAGQQEIGSLQKRLQETQNTATSSAASPAPVAQIADLQSQIDDLRRQLDSAEKEKALLAEKMQNNQEHSSPAKESKKRRESANTQREAASPERESVPTHRTGVRGTVLAYNQAYNFVVLNLGARNGVETNSEMLVLRDGTLLGKIRISSVEPATAIGDIITNSLARGVQVQPGDTVIYAGTSP